MDPGGRVSGPVPAIPAPGGGRPPVVVGVDGSRGHLATVDLAVAEAVRRRAPLIVAHVWPGRYTGMLRPGAALPGQGDGRRLLDVAARRARHAAPGLEIDTELVDGGPAGALVELSAHAQLMVVGHRDDVLTRHGWGSTAAYLAHHGRCPVLVRRGAVRDRGPVVLAASGDETAAATVACAFAEADRCGARLVAVHVWSDPTGRTPTGPSAVLSGCTAERDAADRRLAEALAGYSRTYPDVVVERLVLHDMDVAYTLERASQRGRLLIAGMGRNGRFAELLYGSLRLSLMRAAACPVLLVPPQWSGHPERRTATAGAGPWPGPRDD